VASYQNRFAPRFRKALAAVGFGVRASDTQADSAVATITAGASTASGAEADGSLYVSSDGGPEFRYNSTWGGLPVVVASSAAASSAVTNTTTETNFDTTATIAANSLAAGSVLRIKWQGIATATNATDTLTIRVKVGSTAVLATAAVDVADDDIFGGYFDVVIRTVGTGGTMVGNGIYQDPDAAATALKMKNLASTAVDTTAAITVAISAEWSVASASNSCRLDLFSVDLIS
jgi:hypothetical protein